MLWTLFFLFFTNKKDNINLDNYIIEKIYVINRPFTNYNLYFGRYKIVDKH